MVKIEYWFDMMIVMAIMLASIELGFGQTTDTTRISLIPDAFNDLSTEPHVVLFYNKKQIKNQGGHLQGAQILFHQDKSYALLSGSSSDYSYSATVGLSEPPEVKIVQKLLGKPFKHAGGFQLHKNYMAIGIEDNNERNKSRIHIYKIDNPEDPFSQPLAVIERIGAPERATAGCVGIAKVKQQMVLVVGDWDTRNLDFYTGKGVDWDKDNIHFEPSGTVSIHQADKSAWIDDLWLAYQNINLIADASDRLYLIGLTRDKTLGQVADLYEVLWIYADHPTIKKIASKSFSVSNGADFRSGAGIFVSPNGNMGIISCGSHIQEQSFLNIHGEINFTGNPEFR